MLISSLTVTGFSAYADDLTTGSCGDDVTYSFDSDTGTLTISGTGAMKDYLFIITRSPFYGNSSISTVVIEEGVTSIGNYAFQGCTNLANIDIADSVTSIGNLTFSGCTGLTSVVIPKKVSNVNSTALNNCKNLTSISVEAGSEYYSSVDGVLFDVNRTKIVKYPQGKADSNYIIPDTVTSVGPYSFYSCTSLNALEIPDAVTNIDNYAFYGCTALSSIALPDNISNIGSYAFYNCSGISEIIIPNDTCTIYDNTNTIPDNITIKSYCSGSTAETYATTYSKTFQSLGHKSIGISSVTEPTCTEQGYATYSCSNCDYSYTDDYTDAIGHTVVIDEAIPATCTESGKTAGEHCSVCGLVITPQEDITSPGHQYVSVITAPTCTEQGYTIYTCSRCGESYISDELEPLGHTAVVDEAVAATCTESGKAAGEHCSVCGIVLTPQEDIEPLGHNYVPTVTAPTCQAGGYTTYTCSRCGESYIGDETEIGDHSWNDGEITKAATFTENGTVKYTCSVCGETRTEDMTVVTGSCGDNAVYSFEIATGILTISGTGNINSYTYGQTPFSNQSAIKEVVIENGITGIGNYAFSDCPGLISVTIPESVTNIGYGIFYWSYSIEQITVSENNPVFDSRENCNAIIRTADSVLRAGCKTTVIPQGVTGIEEAAFYGCKNLTNITIPDTVTNIAATAFYKCSSLTEIHLPDGLTTIGDYAFYGCDLVHHMVIPDSVTSIGNNAFAGNSATARDSDAVRLDSHAYSLPVARSIIYQNKLYMRFDKPYTNFKNLYSAYFKFAEGGDTNSLNILKSLSLNGPKTYYIVGGQRSSGSSFKWQYSGKAVDVTENPWDSNQPDNANNNENQLCIIKSNGKYNDINIDSTTPGFIACVDLDDINSQSLSSSYYKTNKYVFYNNTVPCSAARYICEANGGYLATITGAEENTVVTNLISQVGDVVLGGIRNSSGNFEWYNGEPFSYTNWNSGEPNNSSSYNGQYYINLYTTGYWDDDCDKSPSNAKNNNGFVCEYAPNNLEVVYTETDATSVNENEITLKATYPDGTTANIEPNSINITKQNGITYNVTVNYENERGESFSLSKRIQLNETGKCGENAYYSFDGSTGTLTITGEGNIYDFSNGASAHFANFYSDIKTVIIDSGITSIGNNTFNGCSALESVSIPDTVEVIGNEAFGNCASLTAISIPENVKAIKQYAFYKCASLIDVVVPKNAETIGKSAFLGCTALQSLTVYNYYADIYRNANTIPSQATLRGCTGSAIQEYAEAYERAFEGFEHLLSYETIEPTCTEKGYTEAVCSVCGYKNRDNYVDENGHSYGEGVVIEENVTYNVVEYTCSVCGNCYTEEIPVEHTHSYTVQETVDASCVENGYIVYLCSVCGETMTEAIPSTGHAYAETSRVEATCTEAGYVTYTCSSCGDTYDDIIYATGHHYQSSIVEAACTQGGYTLNTCTECGNTYISNRTNPLGHSLSDYVFNNDSSEYFDGTETAQCSRCGETIIRNVAPPKVYSDAVQAEAGEEITVPVYIRNNTGLAGFGFEFEYDSSVLTPISVTNGTLIQSGLSDNLEGDAASGSFKTIWYGTENLDGNGILMYLNFAVAENAKTCNTTINVTCLQDDTFNEEFVNVEVLCTSFSVSISNENEKSEYNGVLNTNTDTVTAGGIFFVSLGENGSNVSLSEAIHSITYNNAAFSFIGYADDNMHSVNTDNVRSTGNIEIVKDNRGTYNSYAPNEIFETLGIKYLIFKANDFAKSGDYEFGYTISCDDNIDVLSASGCTVSIIASAVSEVANVYLENGISAEYNDTVTVPINISNNKGIMGYMINIEYNPQQLEIMMAQRGSSFPGNFNDTITADDIGAFSVLWNGTDDIAIDGVLMNLMFRVLTDEYVVSPITITYSQDDTFNSDYDDVVFNCISGSIYLNEEESHQFIEEIIAPTPNTKGYTKHTCVNCGYSYIDNETDYANDMSVLEAALEKVTGYDSADYSEESYQQLQSVYNAYLDYPNKSIPQTTIDAAASDILTAISNLVPYLYLTVKADNGTISVSNYDIAEKYSVLFGESMTLTATADEGYVFDGWYETVTKRIRSNDETFSFKITSNTDFEARFIKEQSATLTFENESGWVAAKVSKTVSEWAEVATIEDLLPNVPYKLGCTNGRWVYDNATVLQKLQNGENVTVTPEYDETDYENPMIPTPLGDEPALDLYYQLDAENNVGSFTMAAGFPEGCQVESIGIAFYYKKASSFNPIDFDLNINNKLTTSKFEASNEDGIYTVDVKKFTSYYNWSARGYVTYYDKDGNLKVAYSNQINIINREQIG